MESVKKIGDIEVLADDNFVAITLDTKPVLMIPRAATSGLDELATTLQSLVK